MGKLGSFKNKPKATWVDKSAYLDRLQLEESPPSLSYLRKLQKGHLLAVPFENLDMHYGHKILLDYEAIYRKIILENRGGISYELNGLFYHLLCHLGFDAYIVSAKIRRANTNRWGQDFDHMAIVIKLEEHEWLVDVGYPEGPINPIKISVGEVQMDYTRYWKLYEDADEHLVLAESADTQSFESHYAFFNEEKQLIQFLERCEYHQLHKNTISTRQKLITKLLPDGRITLTERKLKIKKLGTENEFPILNEDEFVSKLKQHFGIHYRQLIKLKS